MHSAGIVSVRRPELVVRGVEWRPHELDGVLREHFVVHFAESDDTYRSLIERLGSAVDAVVTNGLHGLSAEQMDHLPNLRIIHCRGAGTDNINLEYAKSRGVVVTSGGGANAFVVADQAMALLLACVRSTVRSDSEARAGSFKHGVAKPLSTVCRKRLGIAGLGSIGLEIAKRAQGFEMEIAYFSRTAKSGLPYTQFPNLVELARWCDFLVLCLPGNSDTQNMVSSDVLQALGSAGYLINVARGSIVDTTALIDALNAGTIAGAGLDVWEGEPIISERLASAPNLTFSPHIGGFAIEAADATLQRLQHNLLAFFQGRPVIHRVV